MYYTFVLLQVYIFCNFFPISTLGYELFKIEFFQPLNIFQQHLVLSSNFTELWSVNMYSGTDLKEIVKISLWSKKCIMHILYYTCLFLLI